MTVERGLQGRQIATTFANTGGNNVTYDYRDGCCPYDAAIMHDFLSEYILLG